ncbi:MAG TPA: aldose epimerase family protein [Phototrophicaceae bacterium]|nr:aldose epimerase family protein [Phototrophicaceae bacterium]
MITQQSYGETASGVQVDEYTLTNANGLEMKVITFGGIITSLRVPDRAGKLDNIALGFGQLEDYESNAPYLGAIIGRFGNRLGNSRFTLDGIEYRITSNVGEHTLHGGAIGFDKVVWKAEIVGAAALKLTYLSPDGEEGFPGNLTTTVVYTLSDDNALRIDYTATTDAPTIINLTNHTYFNLAGNGSGDVYNHRVMINAEGYTPVDAAQIPTGGIAPVEGTPLDFRQPTAVGRDIRSSHVQMVLSRGFDHNFVLNGKSPAARVSEPTTGRVIEMTTTEPAVQFYTGNFLDGTLVGSAGATYRQGDGLCLETQHFPDAPHHDNFPSTVLRPGETYTSTTTYKFLAE